MNPETTIKLWLLACGKQYGITEAHDYRFPDAKSRQQEEYFEYRILSSRPIQTGAQDMTTRSGYNANRKAAQKWLTSVQVDLVDSQNGMFELASCVVGGRTDPAVRSIFGGQCSSPRFVSLENESQWDDEEINYRMRLVVEFEEDITFELQDPDAIVETTELTLEAGGYTWTITKP
jgi:hypothetical protein